MEKWQMREKMIHLVKELVAIPSVNGSACGEANIADHIYRYFNVLPYFQNNPDHLFVQDLKNDHLKRKNVFARVSPETIQTNKMIVIHGHMDTVGVDDYGSLKNLAFSCDELYLAFSKIKDTLPKEIRADLESKDWLFGRGVGDMKSGVAMFMVLLEYFSEHRNELPIHLLFMANPVEENLHTGVIESISVLQSFRDEGYDLICAINSDYVSQKYPEDTTRYLYTGSIGKLLPCFFFHGSGQGMGKTAALLAGEIDVNPQYSCGTGIEFTPPPSLLKLCCKEEYGFAYFNYMVTDKTMPQILAELKKTAVWAMEKTIGGNVYTFSEIYEEAKKKCGVVFDQEMEAYVEAVGKETKDQREICLQVVKFIFLKCALKGPACVLFFAPPYCPHNTLDHTNMREKELYRIVRDVVKTQPDERFQILNYFSFLSDSSYLKMNDDEEALSLLKKNFPIMSRVYPVPVEEIKKLDLPALNLGVYASDAHHWAERLYVPYSFGVLPQIVMKFIEQAAKMFSI